MIDPTMVPVQHASGDDVFVILYKTGMFSAWKVWAVYNSNKSTRQKMEAYLRGLRAIYPEYKFAMTKHALQRKTAF